MLGPADNPWNMCKIIGATLRDFPYVEHAEVMDMAEKSVRLADVWAAQSVIEVNDYGSKFNEYVWWIMQILALQTALELLS